MSLIMVLKQGTIFFNVEPGNADEKHELVDDV